MVSVACLSSVILSQLLQEGPAALGTPGLAGLSGAVKCLERCSVSVLAPFLFPGLDAVQHSCSFTQYSSHSATTPKLSH